jgi:hypothetical protein
MWILWITQDGLTGFWQKMRDSCGKIPIFRGQTVDNLLVNRLISAHTGARNVDNFGFFVDNPVRFVCKTRPNLW